MWGGTSLLEDLLPNEYHVNNTAWMAAKDTGNSRDISSYCGFPCDAAQTNVVARVGQVFASARLILRYLTANGLSSRGTFDAIGRGAIACTADSEILMELMQFRENTQNGIGAAALFVGSSNTTVAHSIFTDNQNFAQGASCIYAVQSTVAVSYTDFLDNEAANAWGLEATTSDGIPVGLCTVCLKASHFECLHCYYTNNRGDSTVGVASNSVAVLANTRFENNQGSQSWSYSGSHQESACIVVQDGSSALITLSSFVSNTGGRAGAVAVLDGSHVAVYVSDFFQNSGALPTRAAGAVFVSSSSATISSSFFRSNEADGLEAAGFLYSKNSTVTVLDSLLTKNSARAQKCAGGMLAFDSTATFRNTTVTENAANAMSGGRFTYGAGGMYMSNAATEVSDSIVADNLAQTATGKALGLNSADQFYFSQAVDVYIINSVISPMVGFQAATINPGIVSGETVGGCEQHPCTVGHECSYKNCESNGHCILHHHWCFHDKNVVCLFTCRQYHM
jgi:hypothetical protein